MISPPVEAIEASIQETSTDLFFEKRACAPQEWWTLFQDDQLENFIQTALSKNPTLQQVHARILAAHASAQNARSLLFPTLGWGADVARQKFSQTGIIPFNTHPLPGMTPLPATGGVNHIPVYFTQYETELTLNYEFDLWGKNRNRWHAALTLLQAKIADESFSRLQMSIAVAQLYFDLQIAYQRKELAEAFAENKSRYFQYIQQRVRANLENAIALNSAEIEQASARQALLQIHEEIISWEYQLKAYLADDFQNPVDPLQIDSKNLPKIPLPEDLPLNLIARRPDLIAQLWLIESAGREIEIAKAGFYPDLNLAAIFGFQTLHPGKLFQWPSAFFDVDPAVSLPIFDGGKLAANLSASQARYDVAIFQYNQLVLNAAKEVLDGIATLRNTHQQLAEYEKMTGFQEKLYAFTVLRMTHNLNSNLDVLVNEGNVLRARDRELMALGSVLHAMLVLIKALGGGYGGN